MNAYATVNALKAALAVPASVTTDDSVLLACLEAASRGIDDQTGRYFYALLGTRYYEWSGANCRTRTLRLDDDLISVTTLKGDADTDQVYELALAANVDYWLSPPNTPPNTPYRAVDLVTAGAQLTSWPTGRRQVQLVGMFGYSYELAVTTAINLPAGYLATDTALVVDSVASLSIGDTVVIGAEQMDVTGVTPGTNTITVVRGINGTTAAAILDNAVVSRRRFPRAIEQATIMQAARMRREGQTGYSGSAGNNDVGGFNVSSSYPMIRDLIWPYRILAVA